MQEITTILENGELSKTKITDKNTFGSISKIGKRIAVLPDQGQYVKNYISTSNDVLIEINPGSVPQKREKVTREIIITEKNKNPAMWESFEEYPFSQSTIIAYGQAGLLGQKKQAIYLKSQYPRSALIPVEEKDLIIQTIKNKDKYTTFIYSIKNIDTEKREATLEKITEISEDIWRTDLSYERAYSRYPYIKAPIRASKNRIKKGKYSGIHYAEINHLKKKINTENLTIEELQNKLKNH
ncbi:MAG: hypothetical protein GY861_21700 [bacterium]|nr:hypothetical protein [bacterium]